MRKNTVTKNVLAGLAAAVALTASAADTYMSYRSGGPYDLADDANWEDGQSPSLDSDWGWYKVRSVAAGATLNLTTSKDMAVNKLAIDGGSGDTYLDLSNKTLSVVTSLNANGHVYLTRGTIKTNDTTRLTLVGGGDFTIDGSNSRVLVNEIQFASANTRYFVTNGGYLKGRLYRSGKRTKAMTNNVVRISGTGSMYDASDSSRNFIDDFVSTQDALPNDFLLEVTDGAVVTNFYGEVGNRGPNTQIVVDNASFYGPKWLNIGGNDLAASNNVVTVRNGGRLALTNGTSTITLTIGNKGENNQLRVASRGDVWSYDVQVGFNDAVGSVAEVSEEGTLRAQASNRFTDGFQPSPACHVGRQGDVAFLVFWHVS